MAGGAPAMTASAALIRTYLAITFLFNLAMSLIWGVDTLFKLGAGLDIFQVMLTNAAFTAGSTVFEIPTGVVADTVGRRVSLLLCLGTLFITTLLYVGAAWRGWGFGAFAWISVFLGLGYTFYTGAVDAWLVDALKATGHTAPLEPVFAKGQMIFGFYSWQKYFLDLLGRNLVWVNGVISSLVGLALIAGNALVAPLARLVGTRTGVLILSIVVQAATATARGALGVLAPAPGTFYPVVLLYLVYAVALGVAMPVKQGYLNAHIPSAQRATIISLDSFFANLGGVVGQSGWGYLAKARGIAAAWVAGGATLLLGAPLYWLARRRDRAKDRF